MRAVSLLLLAVLAPGATSGADRSRIPFTRGAHGEVVVGVVVNGHGPYPFALDTGSSHTSIAESLAADLGAPVVAHAELSTSAGAATRRIVELAELELGTHRGGRLLATELPDTAIDAAGRIKGVLGQDVLAAAPYTIDFIDRAILWNPRRPVNGARLTLVRTDRGGMLVELPQRDRVVRMVPDTGAEALVLFERGDRTLPLPGQFEAGGWEVTTLVARRMARAVRLIDFRVGPFSFADWRAFVVPGQDLPAAHGDGLLPLSAFERVTIDAGGGVIVVDRGWRRR